MGIPGRKEVLNRQHPAPSLDNSAGRDDCAGDMTFPELGHEPFNLSESELAQAWPEEVA
jgi:hypothetical protein